MQTSRFSLKKFFGLLLYFIVVISILNITSCTGKKSNSGKTQDLTASCMTLNKSQLKSWFPAFSNPADPVANQITVLRFYPAYNPVNGSYDITVRAYNSANAQLGNAITLGTGVACGINLPLLSIGARYEVMLADLHVLKADGSLVDFFDKIILTPNVYALGGFNFLKLDMEVKIGDSTTEMAAILPCPPCINCRPPCPDNCTPPCDSTYTDSLQISLDTTKSMIK
jgi:hypothetical protein